MLSRQPGVAVPTRKGGCWAEVPFNASPNRGSEFIGSEFFGCGNYPRKGFLTCASHQDREAAARELQAKSERC